MAVKKVKKSVKKKATKKRTARKASTKKQNMVCAECGRELVIDECGVSESAIYCCGQPMRKK